MDKATKEEKSVGESCENETMIVIEDTATKVGKTGDPKPNGKPLPVVGEVITGSIQATGVVGETGTTEVVKGPANEVVNEPATEVVEEKLDNKKT